MPGGDLVAFPRALVLFEEAEVSLISSVLGGGWESEE